MSYSNRLNRRRGLSLIDCLAAVVVLSMVGMTAAPTLLSVRLSKERSVSLSNLRSIGQGGAMYAHANQGRLFSYSWRGRELYDAR